MGADVNVMGTTSPVGAGPRASARVRPFASRTWIRTAPRAGRAANVSALPSPSRSAVRLGGTPEGSAAANRRTRRKPVSNSALDGGLRALEPDASVGAVAVRFVCRGAAAAQRHSALGLDENLVALRIEDLRRPHHAIGAVGNDLDRGIGHSGIPPRRSRSTL